MSDKRGLTVGEDAVDNGEGYRRGGKAPSADRPSDNDDGERASEKGEVTAVFRRDTIVSSGTHLGEEAHCSLRSQCSPADPSSNDPLRPRSRHVLP